MKAILLLLAVACLSSCTTIYYPNGKPLARISSNARGVSLASSSTSGEIKFSADVLDNSGVITAYGKLVTPALMAWSAAQVMKEAPNTINAFTGNHPKP
jgi:hypothetical protein